MAKTMIVRGDPEAVPRTRDGRPRVKCPAALPIAGATRMGAGVICGVYANDRAKETGEGVTAGQLAVARGGESSDERGGGGGTYMTILSDPTVIARLCCGDDLPVPDPRGHWAHDHFTFCPVWQAEQLRLAEQREQLARPQEADPDVGELSDEEYRELSREVD